jgi:hypothetical protein
MGDGISRIYGGIGVGLSVYRTWILVDCWYLKIFGIR